MTTKPKTRKPAAKTAPKPAPQEVAGEPKREVNEITRLVARWRFLAADQAYQASIAATEKESDRLGGIHLEEEEKIERELATLIPETFEEICKLLDFAIDMAEQGGCDDLEIAMLRNVREGLATAWCSDMKAERKKAVEEAENKMRREVRWVIETKEWKEAQIKEFRAGLAGNREAA
jgi:hypothetical protein